MNTKLTTLTTLLTACLGANAQDICGTVVEHATGEKLPGVAIRLKGSGVGTTTDGQGTFCLTNLPDGAETVVVSYVGMTSQTLSVSELRRMVTNGQPIIIRLEDNDRALDEVVVTALGITREKKSLGYAATDLKGDALLTARGADGNPVQALQGKVAGLSITGNSNAMGGSVKVLIRGVNSLSGNNQPLFVINGVPMEGGDLNNEDVATGGGGYDYGNLIADLNPDDIESISVLKGASASALYGSRANNGVVLITTKKGHRSEGLGVTFNSTVGFEVLGRMPRMQNLYGGGASSHFTQTTINGKTYNTPDYAVDESWGPRLDGQDVLTWYDLAKWERAGKVGDPTTSKWLPTKHDYRTFFRTGVTATNHVAFSQATNLAALHTSYTNTTVKGITPNSQMGKHVFNVSGSAKTPNGRVEVFTNVSYVTHSARGRMETGYTVNNPLMDMVQWWHRNVDFKQLKEMYRLPDGTTENCNWNRTSWDNPTIAQSDNPYWTAYMNYEEDTRHRVFGNVGVKINLTEWLKLQYKTNLDFFSDKQYERIAIGSRHLSSYSETARQQYELNHELMLTAGKTLGDFSLNGMVGTNFMFQHYEMLMGKTSGGLAIPLFYNLKNSIASPISADAMREKGIRSAFMDFSAGWRSMVYLGATLRQDNSSTLPKGKNTYYYPSASGSFIFSELFGGRVPWMDFGKLRMGWAMVGNDTDPYRLTSTYDYYTNIGDGVPGYIHQSQLNNAHLKPERTQSWEVGLEMKFLHSRLGFDLTYYYTRTRDLIVPFSVSSTTGYSTAVTNAGSIANRGVEFSLDATPVRVGRFEWTTTLSLASNRNEVLSLHNDVDYYRLASGFFYAEVGAFVGHAYGVLMGQDFVYDKDGNRLINPSTGLYEVTSDTKVIGKVYPDFTGGWTNTLRWGPVDATVQMTFQKGGCYHSLSYVFARYAGQLKETAENGIRENGIVLPGVIDQNGTPNATRVSAEDYYHGILSAPVSLSTLRTDFLRLREVSVGYTFSMPQKSPIRYLRLSAYGRNLGLWGPDTKDYDPEMATVNSGNIQGLSGGDSPTTVSYGFSINLKF